MANDLIKRAYSESEYTPEFLKRLNESKYVRIYFNRIEKAFSRSYSSGMERHQLIPKRVGGIKTVSLAYGEHFIAHLLLTRMMTHWEDRRKMHSAFNMMLKHKHGQKFSLAKIRKVGTPRTQEWKTKMGEANRARWAARKLQNAK
jgi:hypothetical protein